MSYTLQHSDPNNGTITVPDMPPGINIVDTSLNLIGRGYPNYGIKTAENFLHLLENFAGPTPGPTNPIQGQLWFDNGTNTLKVNDGTNWTPVSGQYISGTAPTTGKTGDLWWDTTTSQLKIYNGTDWTIVGPLSTPGTGQFSSTIEDISGSTHNVILNKIDGDIVSVFSKETFVPVEVLSGFANGISTGITLTTINSPKFVGTAINADSLGGKTATNYLLKNDPTGQIITGKVVYQTSVTNNPEGNNGVVIQSAGGVSSEYIQFYKKDSDAIVANNVQGGKIVFKTKGPTDTILVDTISIQKNSISINTSTSSLNYALNVYGTTNVSNTLTVGNGLNVYGTTNVSSTLTVSGGLISSTSHTPAGPTDIGTTGQIAWDSNYVYICIATNTWKRSPLNTW